MHQLKLRFFVFVFASAFAVFGADSDDKVSTAVEALTRLQNVNLEEKPAVKAGVERVLAKTRGTPNFVRLVQHFKLTNQNPGLLEVAINHPREDSGVAAMRLLLSSRDTTVVQDAVASTNEDSALRVVEVMGNTKDKDAVPLLLPLVTKEGRAVEVRRAAVRGLAQSRDGASALLRLWEQGQLPEKLKFIVASELSAVRWPEVKEQAARLLPPVAGQNGHSLPPISELVKMRGDVARGAEVFRREATGCIKCHQVREEGRDVGPALTEIGTKLAREALYEAILDPSAGVSFGFEAWQVELKSGDEAYGLKASDTPEEIAIKDTNGIVTRYKRSEVASLQQMKTSIMPTGLQQTITTQELADLVEYLVSLKKVP